MMTASLGEAQVMTDSASMAVQTAELLAVHGGFRIALKIRRHLLHALQGNHHTFAVWDLIQSGYASIYAPSLLSLYGHPNGAF
jgi:hypothetical protein